MVSAGPVKTKRVHRAVSSPAIASAAKWAAMVGKAGAKVAPDITVRLASKIKLARTNRGKEGVGCAEGIVYPGKETPIASH
jgi:hypothetical protein